MPTPQTDDVPSTAEHARSSASDEQQTLVGDDPGTPPDNESDQELSLLEHLDRRQNRVLKDLDRLNQQIEQLVGYWQRQRQRGSVAA